MAKIDDCLIRQRRVQEDLHALLHQADFTGIFDPDLEPLCEQVKASERDVVVALFNLLLEGERGTETLAYLLLKDLDSDLAAARARELLQYPRLTARQRQRLNDILTAWAFDLWAREVEGPVTHLDAPETQRLLGLLGQDSVEPEEVGLLWLWSTRMIVPSIRAALLESLMATRSPRALAAAWVELAEGEPEVLLRLTRALAKRPEVEAGELLQQLAEHPELAVRIEADQRLRARPALGTKDPRPIFQKAVLHESPSTGYHVVVFGARKPRGRCGVVSAILDSWDSGLVDCWGQNRLFPEDLDVVFLCGGRLAPASAPKPLDGRKAAGWLVEGEELTRRRGDPIPVQWPIWRHLLRAVPDPVPPRDVVFGLVCQQCRRPIRREDETGEIPLVLGTVAICPTCLAAPRPCAGCESPLQPRSAHAITHPESPRVDFYCDACYAKRIPVDHRAH